MGIVIPFRPREAAKPAPGTLASTVARAEAEMLAAVAEGQDRLAVLMAAAPLIERCRERYGFTILCEGLPATAGALAEALIALTRGFDMLAGEMDGRPRHDFAVCFGHDRLGWLEVDGVQAALAVPDDIEAEEFAHFVRAHLWSFSC